MNHRFRVNVPILILLAAMLACTMPVEQLPPPNEIQTGAALTVQAAISTPSSTKVTSPSPASETSSPTGSPGETITTTPTYSVPVLTVSESTNCRTGPGEEYEIVFTYLTGKELEIVGRYDPGNFWLVKSNESPTGTCWLWGEFVEVTGSHWAVSSVTPPATSTARPPRQPGIVEWNFSCSVGALNFNVIWKDNENNETGYRVFRNGKELTELPANSTTYTDSYNLSFPEESVEYYLQVYGPSGSTNSSVMRMRCTD